MTMKQLPIFAWIIAIGVVTAPFPLQAQPPENSSLEVNDETLFPSPHSTVQLTEAQVRAACAARRYDLLPIPFSDVSPTDWAFEAVMNLYYCIGLPPQQQQ
jgi:hypothetical protein